MSRITLTLTLKCIGVLHFPVRTKCNCNYMLKCISHISLINYTLHHFIAKCDRSITKCGIYFVTKCDKILLQNVLCFLLQTETVLLQNETVITKCDKFIAKCYSYDKMRRL